MRIPRSIATEIHSEAVWWHCQAVAIASAVST